MMTHIYDVIKNCPFNCCSWCATFPFSPFSLQWRHHNVTWPMTSLSWLIMTSSIVIHQWLSVFSCPWFGIASLSHDESRLWRNRWMTSSLMSHSDVIRTESYMKPTIKPKINVLQPKMETTNLLMPIFALFHTLEVTRWLIMMNHQLWLILLMTHIWSIFPVSYFNLSLWFSIQSTTKSLWRHRLWHHRLWRHRNSSQIGHLEISKISLNFK